MRRMLIITLVLCFSILVGNAFAEDYSKYTTEELATMRGSLQDASQEERETFRAEWQKRLQNMTPEERKQYTGRPDNAECQPGSGKMQGGGGYGKGMGRGSGRGSAKGGGGGRW